jgi:hypothetical protein
MPSISAPVNCLDIPGHRDAAVRSTKLGSSHKSNMRYKK